MLQGVAALELSKDRDQDWDSKEVKGRWGQDPDGWSSKNEHVEATAKCSLIRAAFPHTWTDAFWYLGD